MLVSSWLASLLTACSSPEPAPLSVEVLSDAGWVQVDVEVVSPVVRGNNELFVTLQPREHTAADLVSVEAAMVAHGHHSRAARIERDAAGFHVTELELFMTGRWLLELELSVDGQPDRASLPVDVP